MLWLAIVLEYGDAGLNDNKKKKKSFNYLLVNKLESSRVQKFDFVRRTFSFKMLCSSGRSNKTGPATK